MMSSLMISSHQSSLFELSEPRSSVEHGCSLSVISYITFAVITANTVMNINNVSAFLIFEPLCFEKWYSNLKRTWIQMMITTTEETIIIIITTRMWMTIQEEILNLKGKQQVEVVFFKNPPFCDETNFFRQWLCQWGLWLSISS